MKSFLQREDGVVAVIFAVMAIPFIAMAGWAVDYLRLQHVHDTLQQQVDASALAATLEGAAWSDIAAMARAEMGRIYGGSWVSDVDFTGQTLSGDGLGGDFEVVAVAEVPLVFMKLLPGVPETQTIRVSAVARFKNPEPYNPPPTLTELSYEAADFNRLWLYCYWPDRPANDPQLPKRTQMVPIADNGGSVFEVDPGDPRNPEYPIIDTLLSNQYNTLIADGGSLDTAVDGLWRQVSGGTTNKRVYKYVMPQCSQGSYLSIRLENVRDSRTSPSKWNSGGSRYNYYTETVRQSGQADRYDGLVAPNGRKVTILETILCDTEFECTNTVSQGGKIPRNNHTGRTPAQEQRGCEPGKYMYYGWEDRPPELGSSDKDYDDIRIVLECPHTIWLGERNARLIR